MLIKTNITSKNPTCQIIFCQLTSFAVVRFWVSSMFAGKSLGTKYRADGYTPKKPVMIIPGMVAKDDCDKCH